MCWREYQQRRATRDRQKNPSGFVSTEGPRRRKNVHLDGDNTPRLDSSKNVENKCRCCGEQCQLKSSAWVLCVKGGLGCLFKKNICPEMLGVAGREEIVQEFGNNFTHTLEAEVKKNSLTRIFGRLTEKRRLKFGNYSRTAAELTTHSKPNPKSQITDSVLYSHFYSKLI